MKGSIAIVLLVTIVILACDGHRIRRRSYRRSASHYRPYRYNPNSYRPYRHRRNGPWRRRRCGVWRRRRYAPWWRQHRRQSYETTVLTYNAALTPLYPEYETRKLRVSQAVSEQDADVVCLQEVVFEDDMRRIMNKMKRRYPFSWSFLHTSFSTRREVFKSSSSPEPPMKSFPCQELQFPIFQTCFVNNCSSAGGGNLLFLCILQKCSESLFALSDDCRSCLGNADPDPVKLFAMCAAPGEGLNRFQPQGLLLMSKRRILSANKVPFNKGIPQVYPRGLLEVEIAGIGKVACTHLTVDLTNNGFPYFEFGLVMAGVATSFVQQQAGEIATIGQLYPSGPILLAGDFNTGPSIASEGIIGQVPVNYQALLGQGFSSQYVTTVGKCTYCADNPIAFNNTQVLDDVLTKGVTVTKAARVLDTYKPGEPPLSDHYGVLVSFCAQDDY